MGYGVVDAIVTIGSAVGAGGCLACGCPPDTARGAVDVAARCATVLMTWGVGNVGKLPINAILPDGGEDDNSSTTGSAKVGGSASSAASAGGGEDHDGAPASAGSGTKETTSILVYVKDDGYTPATADGEDADTGAATSSTGWPFTWWGGSAQPTEETPLTKGALSSPV